MDTLIDPSASLAASEPMVAEFDEVRVVYGLEADGYRLARGTRGTVVAIYGGGAAFAVEIVGLPGGTEVVTLRAEQIEPVR